MKPTIALCVTICSLVGLAYCQEWSTINPMIQSFRQDYRKFRDGSLRRVDRCFFNVYNALNSSLVEVLKPFHRIRLTTKETCSKIKQSQLDKSVKSRVESVCSNFAYSLRVLLAEHHHGLENLYAGEVTALSPAGNTAMTLLNLVELQMDDMWDVYIRNISCVGPLLKKFLPSYDPLIDNICFINNATIHLLEELFRESKSHSFLLGMKLTSAIRKADSCLDISSTAECFDKAVSSFVANWNLDFEFDFLIL